jgi:type IV pilus assembly protein PilP
MMSSKPNYRRLAVAALLVLLAGCARSDKDLVAFLDEVKNRPAPALDPLPVMQQFETFEYVAEGLRDPFSAPVANRDSGSGPRPDINRRKEILEAYPLDGLNMVGSIGTGKDLVALVLAPDKVTHRVRSGIYMGQNDGRVTGVFEDRIELIELVPDGAGGWLERQAKIALEDQ